MAALLTDELHADLERHGGKPMPVVDPIDQKVYFLVAGDLFERFRALFDDEPFDISETYAAQSAVARQAGWDDPEMDVYDNYDAHRPQS